MYKFVQFGFECTQFNLYILLRTQIYTTVQLNEIIHYCVHMLEIAVVQWNHLHIRQQPKEVVHDLP